MPLPPDGRKRHDDAARLARQELEAHWRQWNARDVAMWLDAWCHFGSEGPNHDRLARILMDVTGVRSTEVSVVVDFEI